VHSPLFLCSGYTLPPVSFGLTFSTIGHMDLRTRIREARFTVLLGKNGAGKSTFLRQLSEGYQRNVKYVSPERGGSLQYDPNVDHTMAQNENWMRDTRRNNRFEQFRQQSAAQFRMLEMLVLREIESDSSKRADPQYTFDSIALDKINALLPAVRLVRGDRGFDIRSKTEDQPIRLDQISSGEAELIALAIEVLVFSLESASDKLLLLDEPDVHLHPDLQQRFTAFIQDVAENRDVRVVIATHSTAIVGAFTDSADLQIVPITWRGQAQFGAFRSSTIAQEILPVFGVHPLSTAFNKNPVILVEGEDDRRVLEQIVRSSNGRVKLSPCPVGTVSALAEWERWLNDVLPALYDQPRAFSLRDLDDGALSEIDNAGIVTRIRLNCYAIENLLLTDECLQTHGHTEETFKQLLAKWVADFPQHQASSSVGELLESFERRRTMKIKDVRNIVVALLGSAKPWEVIVGQLIAATPVTDIQGSEHSISNYLGTKARALLSPAAAAG
jgi:ABC-type cobalamin/Fe3+-siderophores transport system ATPase subunit